MLFSLISHWALFKLSWRPLGWISRTLQDHHQICPLQLCRERVQTTKITHPIAPSQNSYPIFAWFTSHLIKTCPGGDENSQQKRKTKLFLLEETWHNEGARCTRSDNAEAQYLTQIYPSLEVTAVMICRDWLQIELGKRFRTLCVRGRDADMDCVFVHPPPKFQRWNTNPLYDGIGGGAFEH